MEKFIKANLDQFVTALCEYLEDPEKLIYCTCNQFGNYVVQTLLNVYQGDERLDKVIEVDTSYPDHEEKREQNSCQ